MIEIQVVFFLIPSAWLWGGKPAPLGAEGTIIHKKYSRFVENFRVSEESAKPRRQLGKEQDRRIFAI